MFAINNKMTIQNSVLKYCRKRY